MDSVATEDANPYGVPWNKGSSRLLGKINTFETERKST